MSTFLQLCQDVARESGVVPNIGTPTSVAGQTGRLSRVVEWVRAAWIDIQNERSDWLWMEADFEADTVAGTRFYAGSDLGLTRFSSWIWRGDDEDEYFTIFDPADGRATEGFLYLWEFDLFRRRAMIGSAYDETGKPTYITVNPDNRIGFYPIPDKGYTIRGRYRKSPQTMTANTDTPEMPADFHAAIKWRALTFAGQFDESVVQQPAWTVEFDRIMGHLRRHQTPRVMLGGALA